MSRLFRSVGRYTTDQRGSVAILFGVSIFVLLGTVGLALDFARAHSTKSALQQDLDATLLFVATEKVKQGAQFDVQQAANDYMAGLHRQRQSYTSSQVTVTMTDDRTFAASVETRVSFSFSRALGFYDTKIVANSTVAIGQKPIEIALVLDNTGSMDGAKIDALRSSAKSLVDTVFAAPNAAQNVKISVVPFAEYVNVGMANRHRPWVSVPPDSTSTQNVCNSYQQPSEIPGSCADVAYTANVDGTPTQAYSRQCQYTYGPPTRTCGDVTTTETWGGCVGSRDYPLNTRDENYTVKVPGVMNVNCPTALTPMTNDETVIGDAIDAMNASGNTYIPAGLMWGWATLSSSEPFQEAQDQLNGQSVRKIMILMTDGFNTLSPSVPYNGAHFGNDTAQANTLTQELCTNIKTANIELYTMAFQVTDENIKTILENCASSSTNFYDATDSTQLQQAFEKIAANLSALRITQ